MWPFKPKPTSPAESDFSLYGYDLKTEWHFLGSTKSLFDVQIMFFVSQKDESIRDYLLQGTEDTIESFVTHGSFMHTIRLWKVDELGADIYTVVKIPSNYLRHYMLVTGNWVWNDEKDWWVINNDPAVYHKAVKAEDTQGGSETAVISTDENVVTVNFKKK